jgi:putative membrane protein
MVVDPNPGDPESLGQSHAARESESLPVAALATRGVAGGILMGLANLVPGISGGTMLLATGVYPDFISAIAELTTLRFKARSVLILTTIAGSAALAILLLAGAMKALVVEERWAMYSLFIGLTLGGIPLVWRLARPGSPTLWLSAGVAFGVMVLMSLGESRSGGQDANTLLLVISGLAGASAMILPGVSGGYLLLLLGQYEPILGAVDGLKDGLLAGRIDSPGVGEALAVLLPVGVGVVLGIVGVANLIRWLLDRFEKPTLGMLLGLLLGSVVGLYPFQGAVQPEAGDHYKGMVLSETAAREVEQEDWATERFGPTPTQAAASLALILVGLGATLLVDRVGRPNRRVAAD